MPLESQTARWVCAGLLLASAGCHSTRSDVAEGGAATGGADDTTADSDPSEEADGISEGDDEGTKLDVAPEETEGVDPDGKKGCEKIDFLFVVDNSSSMHDQQESLTTSFPGFIETIEDTLNIQDFRILVVDTDEWGPIHDGAVHSAHHCTPWLSSNPIAAICTPANPDCCAATCATHPMMRCDPANGGNRQGMCDSPPDSCDGTLGAGVVRGYPALERCDIAGPERYLTTGQPNLTDAFECMALVGEDGNFDERPMEAMMRAVAPDMVGPGGCNEGFLRDDAILVVTILSDSIPESACEQQSPTPDVWHQALVQAKSGDPEAVVVLGLFSGVEPYGWQERCRSPSNGYFEFLSMFGDNALGGSICEPDYSPFFREAVENRIKEACEDFTPPEG